VPSLPGSPTERAKPNDQYRRFLIAAGTQRYDHLAEEDWLNTVPRDLEQVVELFCGQLGYQRVLDELGESPTSDQLRHSISSWITADDRGPDDVVTIYYSGHGVSKGRHYLLARNSKAGNLAGTAVATEDFAWMLGDDCPVQHLLVIIDACYAGRGIHDLGRIAAQLADVRPTATRVGSGLWFVASARPKDEADQGVFPRALTDAVKEPQVGVTQEYLGLDTIVQRVNETFAGAGLTQRARVDAVDASGLAPFIPNQISEPGVPLGWDLETLARRQPSLREDIAEHWDPRARGVALSSDPGWYFTGRTRVLRELVAWFTNPDADHRARVVTGWPGSGKSAVLAWLFRVTDPNVRRTAPLEHFPPGTVPPEGDIDLAIHARYQTLPDVIKGFAAGIGTTASTAEQLIAALKARPRRRVVIIDALDEAADPSELATGLVQPLLNAAAQSGLRLLLGTRRPLVEELGPKTVVLDLDDPTYLELDDLAGYVTKVLLAEHEPHIATPYRGQRALAEEVGWAIAQRANPSFLIARIVARNLISDEEPVDVTATDWQTQLPSDIGDAFDAYLERFGPDEKRVRDLLTPLAWAEGGGLPWEHLWAPLAQALSSKPRYTDDDIRWLQRAAGAYIVEDRDHGRSVYRLYHQLLSEHLRDDNEIVSCQRRIANILIQHTPRAHSSQPDWFMAHPYIRHHLATHAAAAGLLDPLLEDACFLLAADPNRLLQALPGIVSPTARSNSIVYQAVVHQLRVNPIPIAAAYLELASRQQGNVRLAEHIGHLDLGQPWSVPWAWWRPEAPHRIVGHYDEDREVTAVAMTKLDSQPVVVSGTRDGSVQIWSLATSDPIGESGSDPTWGATALGLGEISGRPVVAIGNPLGSVGVWNVNESEAIAQLHVGHEDNISTLIVAELGDRPVVISGSYDGTVRVWDVPKEDMSNRDSEDILPSLTLRDPWTSFRFRTSRRIRRRLGVRVNSSQTIRYLALGEMDGRQVAVSVSQNAVMRAWDLGTGHQIWKTEHDDDKISTIVTSSRGDLPVVVSGGYDGALRVWELATGAPTGKPITGHETGIGAVAQGKLERGLVVVSGDYDGIIRLWDLATGRMIYEPLVGHESWITALAVGELNGRSLAISASRDGTVRAWSLSAPWSAED
jgi:hypothetical protein